MEVDLLIGGVLYSALLCIACLGLWLWVFFRRNFFPLSGRYYIGLHMEFLAVFCYLFFSLLRFGSLVPCNVYAYGIFFSMVLTASSFFAHGWRTIVKYSLASHFGSLLNEDEGEKKTLPVLVRYRSFWDTSKPLLMYIASVIAIFLVIIIPSAWSLPRSAIHKTFMESQIRCSTSSEIIWNGLLMLYLIIQGIVLFIVLKRRGVSGWVDGLFVISDLKFALVFWTVVFIGWVILLSVLSNSFTSLFAMTALVIHMYITVGRSIFETYRNQTEKIPSSNEPIYGQDQLFKRVMEVPTYKMELKKFMEGCWCVENLLFWEDVEKLHGLKNRDLIIKEITRMKGFYFSDDPLLNLEFRTFNSLMQKLSQEAELSNPLVFDTAQKEIQNLMIYDTMVKWKLSKHFPEDLKVVDVETV